MSTLTKTSRVMHWIWGGQTPVFAYEDHRISIDRKAWEDMGKPKAITVTIEPGDQLNQ